MATDRPKTFKDLIEAAEHGDPRAQFELGRAHFRGEGAPLDRLEAERWLKRAAQGGHAVARIYLAELRGKAAQPASRDQAFDRWLDGAMLSIKAGEVRRAQNQGGRDFASVVASPLMLLRRLFTSRYLPAILLAGLIAYLVVRLVQTGSL
jgi:TPR repeat protein